MSASMRAKLVVGHIEKFDNGDEKLNFHAVSKNEAYPEDGTDENNTFAKWTPSANLEMFINNQALHGKFKVGDQFYVDFTPAD